MPRSFFDYSQPEPKKSGRLRWVLLAVLAAAVIMGIWVFGGSKKPLPQTAPPPAPPAATQPATPAAQPAVKTPRKPVKNAAHHKKKKKGKRTHRLQ